MKRPEEYLIEEADPGVGDYIRHLESMVLEADFGKYKKAKPILVIKTTDESIERLREITENSIGDSLKAEYHVLASYGQVEYEVL